MPGPLQARRAILRRNLYSDINGARQPQRIDRDQISILAHGPRRRGTYNDHVITRRGRGPLCLP